MKKCAFVVPVFIPVTEQNKLVFFEICLESIFSQSDEDWILIIIDDNSNNEKMNNIINMKKKTIKNDIIVHRNSCNLGPGESRNIGIDIAHNYGCQYILFQDADDIANPLRVQLTKEKFSNSQAGVIYSSFIPIDENGDIIDEDKLSFSIKDILQANKNIQLSGKEIWIKIATETGYINMTSSTSVRIDYALKVKFPNSRASEDAYVWMLYSALGAEYLFVGEIPCKYRIPQNTDGSSSRSYVGKEKFYELLCETNEKAFFNCIKYSEKCKKMNIEEKRLLTLQFYKKLCETLNGEGMSNCFLKIREKIAKIEI